MNMLPEHAAVPEGRPDQAHLVRASLIADERRDHRRDVYSRRPQITSTPMTPRAAAAAFTAVALPAISEHRSQA